MPPLEAKDDFRTLLKGVTRHGLRQASTDQLAQLAKQLWYGQEDLLPVLNSTVAKSRVTQRKRALYLVDRLRRFPCVPSEKALKLKAFVSDWASVKPTNHSRKAGQLYASHQLDKLAFEWGLSEDVSPQMKDLLLLQTRHYAASLDVPTGYSHDSSTRSSTPDQVES